MKNNEKAKKLLIAGVSFFLMVSIAGFINYRYNPEREKDLGQTVYVSTNVDENKNDNNEGENKEANENYILDENNDNYNFNVETVDTISKFKSDRDNMNQELSNNYYAAINNANSSPETISQYQEKLADLIEEKNNIALLERIIISKGVEDAVVINNSTGKTSVIIKSNELSDELAAQIMQAVIDQLGVEASNISIQLVDCE